MRLVAQQRSDLVLTHLSANVLDDFGRRLLQRLRAQGGIEVSAIFDMSDDLLVDRFNSLLGPLTIEEARAPRENNPKLLAPQAWLIQLQSGKQLPQIQLLARLARDFPAANVSFIILAHPTAAEELLESRIGQTMVRWALSDTNLTQESESDAPAPAQADQAAAAQTMQAFRQAQQTREAHTQPTPAPTPMPTPSSAKAAASQARPKLPRDGMRMSFLVAGIALALLAVSVGLEYLLRPDSGAKVVQKPKVEAVAPTESPAARAAQDAAAFRSAVEKRFEEWTKLWSARKADEFLALFDPAFPDLQAYSNNRRARIEAAKYIEVKASKVEFIATDPGRITVRFVQSYQSDTHSALSPKELVWVNSPQGPRIIAERTPTDSR